jgi:hypothetical protein
MNEIIQPFMTFTSGINHFMISKEEHKYEAFFERDSSFKNGGNITKLENENRLFTTDFTINVLGYLLGAGANSEKPKIITSETIVEIKIPKEKEMFGESTDLDKKKYY